MIGDETPQAESTTLSNGGESDPSVPLNVEQDDSTEADRNHTNIVKKSSAASRSSRSHAIEIGRKKSSASNPGSRVLEIRRSNQL